MNQKPTPDNATCQFCGGEIRFRMIRGVCVPIHAGSEACITHENKGWPDSCHQTRCPRCDKTVYFVRHNNGSVWFEDLGKPWEKHGCFSDASVPVPPEAPEAFQLMRIRSVVSYRIRINGIPIAHEPGFVIHVGRDRKPPEVWEIYPNILPQDVMRWRGRKCYISSKLMTLVLLDGTTFPLAYHLPVI